jgi:uncharacterized hydrophobic protein (TIGR00341 family)
MAHRLIEISAPSNFEDQVKQLIESSQFISLTRQDISDNKILFRLILPVEKTAEILDLLEKDFAGIREFQMVMLPIEAIIPRPKAPEAQPPEQVPADSNQKKKKKAAISREELYSHIETSASLSIYFVLMIIFSSIVAAVGLHFNNLAVIIGAMLIAPLLGPNVALSLATTLGDVSLARSALKAALSGIAITVILSILIGAGLGVNPENPEIASRTAVSLGDIILALASGSAAALSFTSGLSGSLIGVMVAVALLPPLVTFGLLTGAGFFTEATGALMLFVTNLICINLAGVVTFLAQGIRPLKWWEISRAKKTTLFAISLWTLLLAALVLIIILAPKG